jgi:hypothetical protein
MAYTYTTSVSIPEEVETDNDYVHWIQEQMEFEDFDAITAWLQFDQFNTASTYDREIIENELIVTRTFDNEADAIQNMAELKELFKSDTVTPVYSDITEV